MENKTNIYLSGMAGCGKSTLGKRLAEVTGKTFLDFDDLLEQRQKMSVAALLRSSSQDRFLEYEKELALSLDVENTIIALSGSVPLVDTAMEHLRKKGYVIYIKTPLETIESRLGSMQVDRIVGMWENNFADVYNSRLEKYVKSADFTFENNTRKNTLWIFTDFYTFYKKLPIHIWNATSSSTSMLHF